MTVVPPPVPPEFDLRGRSVLVTGAAGLIGREAADALAAHGATLTITDRETRTLQTLRRDLERRHGGRVEAWPADLSRTRDVRTLISRTCAAAGRIDVLVHLAGLDAKPGADDLAWRPLHERPLQAWPRMQAVNSGALLHVCAEVIRAAMLPQRSGSIVTVASTYGAVGPDQRLYGGARHKPIEYIASKGATLAVTRYLATTYGCQGIRANCLVPHGVAVDAPAAMRRRFARGSPLGRLCAPREMRGPIVFLASAASSYMTGSALVVDGGWTAW